MYVCIVCMYLYTVCMYVMVGWEVDWAVPSESTRVERGLRRRRQAVHRRQGHPRAGLDKDQACSHCQQ